MIIPLIKRPQVRINPIPAIPCPHPHRKILLLLRSSFRPRLRTRILQNLPLQPLRRDPLTWSILCALSHQSAQFWRIAVVRLFSQPIVLLVAVLIQDWVVLPVHKPSHCSADLVDVCV